MARLMDQKMDKLMARSKALLMVQWMGQMMVLSMGHMKVQMKEQWMEILKVSMTAGLMVISTAEPMGRSMELLKAPLMAVLMALLMVK